MWVPGAAFLGVYFFDFFEISSYYWVWVYMYFCLLVMFGPMMFWFYVNILQENKTDVEKSNRNTKGNDAVRKACCAGSGGCKKSR